MGKISIYSPQMTVPVVAAPMRRADTSGLALAQGANRLMSALEEKQQNDARTSVALERIKAERAFTEKFMQDQQAGMIDDSYPGSFMDNVDAYYAPILKQYEGNQYAYNALLVAKEEALGNWSERAISAAGEASRIRRLGQFEDTHSQAVALAITDPSKLGDARKLVSEAMTGITNPRDRRAAEEKFQQLDKAYFTGLIQKGQADRAIAELGNLSPEQQKNLGADVAPLLNAAEAKQKENWNLNFSGWMAQKAQNDVKGISTPLPDAGLVGQDHFNDAIRLLNPKPSQELLAKQDKARAVWAEVRTGGSVATDNPDQVSGMNTNMQNAIDDYIAKSFGTDNLGNPKATDEQKVQATREYIYTYGKFWTDTFGAVPEAVQNTLNSSMRSKDGKAVARGLDLYDQLTTARGGVALRDIPQDVQMFYSDIHAKEAMGMTRENAIAEVQRKMSDKLRLTPQTLDELRGRFNSENQRGVKVGNGKTISLVDDFINRKADDIGVVNDLFRQKVAQRASELYIQGLASGQNPDMTAAIEAGYKEISAVYRPSYINGKVTPATPKTNSIISNPFSPTITETRVDGKPTLMMNPPESPFAYGIYSDLKGSSPSREDLAKNVQWIQEQAVQSLQSVGIKVPKYDGFVRMEPDPNGRTDPMTGKPLYVLWVKTQDGKEHMATDSKLRPLIWKPDPAKSELAKSMLAEIARQTKFLQDAATIRKENAAARLKLEMSGKRPLGGYQ